MDLEVGSRFNRMCRRRFRRSALGNLEVVETVFADDNRRFEHRHVVVVEVENARPMSIRA